MAEFGDFLKLISDAKLAKIQEQSEKENRLTEISERVKESNPFKFHTLEEVYIEPEPIMEELPESVLTPELTKLFNEQSYQQPEVNPVDNDVRQIRDKLKFIEQWMGKISLAGPGGGEVNLRYLDDIVRSSIYDGRYLRYNATLKKFEFAEVNPHDIVYTTNNVTTSTYTVSSDDYYVGVTYNGPTTITLPSNPSSGRMLIIKDESGNASVNPITVLGTVDNDPTGFIIQLDNGAIQLLYRNGWRIV
jgi:hypothetical protein